MLLLAGAAKGGLQGSLCRAAGAEAGNRTPADAAAGCSETNCHQSVLTSYNCLSWALDPD